MIRKYQTHDFSQLIRGTNRKVNLTKEKRDIEIEDTGENGQVASYSDILKDKLKVITYQLVDASMCKNDKKFSYTSQMKSYNGNSD